MTFVNHFIIWLTAALIPLLLLFYFYSSQIFVWFLTFISIPISLLILSHRAVEYAMTSTGIDVLSYHGDLNSKERCEENNRRILCRIGVIDYL